MRGVSSAVMCGQYGNFGTGAFNLLLDMREFADQDCEEIKEQDDIEKMFGDIHTESGEGECSKKQIEIKNNIVNIKTTKTDLCDDGYDIGF
jgi:hypothetical protein